MTREQINQILSEGGVDTSNSKLLVNTLLNAFNDEKKTAVEEASKIAKDEIEAKYKDFVKPEDHQKIVDELNAEKGKAALNDRKAKYKAKNLNIDDEDVLTLIEGKLKDSEDFDKDLDDYIKAHPSFVTHTEAKKEKRSTFFQGLDANKGKEQEDEATKMNNMIRGSLVKSEE